jgi:hypothetical protein
MAATSTASASLLVGAGFSTAFGVPTMGPFYSEFDASIRRRRPELVPVLSELEHRIEGYHDLETLLVQLLAAEEVTRGLPPELTDDGRVREWWRLRGHSEAICRATLSNGASASTRSWQLRYALRC